MAAAQGNGQAPLLQRVVDLEEFLGRLDQQGADRAAAMAFERGGSFPLSALAHAGIESQVSDELSAVGKTVDIANGRDQSIESNQIDAAEPREPKQLFFLEDLSRHVAAQLLAPGARSDQSGMELLQ